MAAELSDRELRLLRMRSRRLLAGDGEKTVAGAASAALTIQAQDVPAATLAVRARTNGLTAAAGAHAGRPEDRLPRSRSRPRTCPPRPWPCGPGPTG